MALQVYSARLPHHGLRGYSGPDAFDITRGSGGGNGSPFAPSRELLNEAQRRKKAARNDAVKLVEAWAWYVPRYLEEMRASYKRDRAAWRALLERPRVVVLCYCGTAQRCHRAVLRAQILPTLGAVDCGELTPAGANASALPAHSASTSALLDLAQSMSGSGGKDQR
jgi:uncharacterized protein YeaO (DUF488 family)